MLGREGCANPYAGAHPSRPGGPANKEAGRRVNGALLKLMEVLLLKAEEHVGVLGSGWLLLVKGHLCAAHRRRHLLLLLLLLK